MIKTKKIVIASCILATMLTLTACEKKTTSASNESSTQDNAAKIIEDIATVQAFTDEAVSEDDITAIVNSGINAPSAMNSQPWHFSVVTDKSKMEEINSGMSMGFPKGNKPAMPDSENTDGDKPAMPDGDKSDGDKPAMPDGDKPEGDKPEMPDGDMPKDFPAGDKPLPPNGGDASAAKAGIADAPLAIVISCKEGSDLDAGLATQNMSAEAQLLGYGTKIISSPTIALNGDRQAEYKEMLGIPEDMKAVCVLLVGKTASEKYDAVTSATTRNDASETVTYVK